MQLAFYFDQTRCIGCHTCVVACKDWHDLPAEHTHWRRVSTYEEGKFPEVGVYHVSVSCNHCERPACAEACPEEAIYKREADGVVLVDAEKCTACHACEDACHACEGACPYGAIQFRPEEGSKAEKCCFCVDRIDGGETPICVSACPMRALDYGDFDSLSSRPDAGRSIRHLPEGAETTAALIIKPKQ